MDNYIFKIHWRHLSCPWTEIWPFTNIQERLSHQNSCALPTIHNKIVWLIVTHSRTSKAINVTLGGVDNDTLDIIYHDSNILTKIRALYKQQRISFNGSILRANFIDYWSLIEAVSNLPDEITGVKGFYSYIADVVFKPFVWMIHQTLEMQLFQLAHWSLVMPKPNISERWTGIILVYPKIVAQVNKACINLIYQWPIQVVVWSLKHCSK